MRNNFICLTLLMFILAGCIEPYHGKTESIDSILVVEGIITSGTTRITLSRSVGLDENIYGDAFAVDHAMVYVESEDGTTSRFAYSSGYGIYTIETGELDVDTKYRLVIQVDGDEYQSSFLTPAISPPVDISFTSDENNIHVCVTTHGYDHQPGYYLWSYKEDWEIHATVYGDSINIGRKIIYHDLNSPDNRYYCWKKDSSRVLILGTTEKLIENTIREQKIQTFSRTDYRSSVLYRAQVKQNTIHKEAYDFYYNLQKNIEQTGSIFGAIPSEIMGNIRCVSNADIPVIGYVDVSTTSTAEKYLTNEFFESGFAYWQCVLDTFIYNPRDWFPLQRVDMDYIFFMFVPDTRNEIFINLSCVDCTRSRLGGTKRKPKNWPNNHQ